MADNFPYTTEDLCEEVRQLFVDRESLTMLTKADVFPEDYIEVVIESIDNDIIETLDKKCPEGFTKEMFERLSVEVAPELRSEIVSKLNKLTIKESV